MPLVKDAYLQALKSPIITLIIDNDPETQVPCPLAFLALHSEYFAKILSKSGTVEDGRGTLHLQRVSQSSVETFVHWCHKVNPWICHPKSNKLTHNRNSLSL